MDIDGCLVPTNRSVRPADPSDPPDEGYTRVVVEHKRPDGMKVRPRFVRSDGTPDTRPFKDVIVDTFNVPNHIIDFMRAARVYFEPRFASWWFPTSSAALCEALGIEPWDNTRHPNDFMTGGNHDDYKWNYVKATHDGRPFAWVDDAELLRRHHDWAIDLPFPTLCITPDHATGLTQRHVDDLRAFGLDNQPDFC
jgi:hypothetical protein